MDPFEDNSYHYAQSPNRHNSYVERNSPLLTYHRRQANSNNNNNSNNNSNRPVSPNGSSHNQQYYQQQPQQPQIPAVVELNRSRSSSWPNRPVTPLNYPQTFTPTTRSRSSTLTESPNQNNKNRGANSPQRNETTMRKKRKRLNPQRRSFYKALHTDFPKIAEALREARQGINVISSLTAREIAFSTIEARPPQDPTNLNVRRYNDMVFIWDPTMQIWLQVPGSGDLSDLESSFSQDPPTLNSPLARGLSSPTLSHLSQSFSMDYEPYVFDSTSEEEDDSRSLNELLPMNLINDIV